MEKQNTSIENEQIKENNEVETNVPQNKTTSKKTILIASIVTLIAILTTIISMLFFIKSPEEKAIIGEWYEYNDKSTYIKFFKNGTGEYYHPGYNALYDFKWKYNSEEENYVAHIGGERISIEIKTEENLTVLYFKNTPFFKDKEHEQALSLQFEKMQSLINSECNEAEVLPLEKEILVNGIGIKFNKIEMIKDSFDCDQIVCNILITAYRDISEYELDTFITIIRSYDMGLVNEWNEIRIYSFTNQKRIPISENELKEGELLNTDIILVDNPMSTYLWENMGAYVGCVIIEFDNIQYYINFADYIKN